MEYVYSLHFLLRSNISFDKSDDVIYAMIIEGPVNVLVLNPSPISCLNHGSYIILIQTALATSIGDTVTVATTAFTFSFLVPGYVNWNTYNLVNVH